MCKLLQSSLWARFYCICNILRCPGAVTVWQDDGGCTVVVLVAPEFCLMLWTLA